MPVIEVKFNALPKQKEFLRSQAKEVLYSGGLGGGKSITLCWWVVMRAAHPMARVFLGRRTLDSLKQTTLKTLLIGDGQMPPVLPHGSYVHIKSERTIKLKGGGEIVYGGVADGGLMGGNTRIKLGSLNLTSAAIDQVEELTKEEYLTVLGRLRSTGDGIVRQFAGACNPASPSHHLALRYGITGDSKVEGTQAILTSPLENPHLPADYIASLLTTSGVWRMRMVEGRWVSSEGVIFDRWLRSKHAVIREDGPWVRQVVAIDDGISDPFVAGLLLQDNDGRWHLKRSVYRTGMSESEKVEAVKDLCPADEAERVICDPSALGIKNALKLTGYTVSNAVNAQIPGINEVYSKLGDGPDGKPLLTVDPSNTQVITDIETQEWLKGRIKEAPNHNYSHGNDMLRYGLMHYRTMAAAAFDTGTLARMKDTAKEPRYTGDLLSKVGWDIELDLKIRKHERSCVHWTDAEEGEGGAWRLWCEVEEDEKGNERPNSAHTYVVAVSVGTGLTGSPTVIKVGDGELREVVAEAVLEEVTPETAARIACMVGLWFEGPHGHARLIWKHEGPGVAFGETVRRLGYGRVYHHHEEGTPSQDPGWRWSKEGIHALFGEFRNAVAAKRYVERSRETAFDAQRWIFHPNGTLGPATLDADGTTLQVATDRAMASMLLAHAFAWVAANPASKPKPLPYSIEWNEAREKAEKQKGRRGRLRA